jgi:hypothetical protein
VGTGSALFAPLASAQNVAFKPEKDAKLRVLRWSRFVQGDIDAYMVNVKKFTEKTGIEVRVDNEGWEDVRPEGGGRSQHRRRAPTSSCRPTTTPTSIPTSCST